VYRGECEFLLSDVGDCLAGTDRGMSVRHRLSDRWVTWPACGEHEQQLAAELRLMGFVVTPAYDLGDAASRLAAEARADAA
jgi:hypothetical protein